MDLLPRRLVLCHVEPAVVHEEQAVAVALLLGNFATLIGEGRLAVVRGGTLSAVGLVLSEQVDVDKLSGLLRLGWHHDWDGRPEDV